MPRDRRPLEQVVLTHGARDAALDRAAGLVEDDDDPREFTLAAFSARLRQEWPDLSLADRMKRLRAELAAKFLKRFGFAWDGARLGPMTQDPPWPPPRMPWSKGRRLTSRSRMVAMFDFENVLGLPKRKDGSDRFLSVLEFTWLSILGGNWPDALPANATPERILAAERETMKKALARGGQRPAVALGVTRVRRGPRRRRK
jgi:hypothetical protein